MSLKVFIFLFLLYCIYLVVFIILLKSTRSLNPTEIGIYRNGITKNIDYNKVYTSGIFFLGPFAGFIKFPYTVQYFENNITSRTSVYLFLLFQDSNIISFVYSVEYRLIASEIIDLYKKYSTNYEKLFISEINSKLITEAQSYLNEKYYYERDVISDNMKNIVESFFNDNYVSFIGFQLKEITVSKVVEDKVIDTVVKQITNSITEFESRIEVINKESEQLYASAQAEVDVLITQSENDGKVIVQNATAIGFKTEQEAEIEGLMKINEIGLTIDNLIKFKWLVDIDNIKDGNQTRITGFKTDLLKRLIMTNNLDNNN